MLKWMAYKVRKGRDASKWLKYHIFKDNGGIILKQVLSEWDFAQISLKQRVGGVAFIGFSATKRKKGGGLNEKAFCYATKWRR